jgi:hypothetical protein
MQSVVPKSARHNLYSQENSIRIAVWLPAAAQIASAHCGKTADEATDKRRDKN